MSRGPMESNRKNQGALSARTAPFRVRDTNRHNLRAVSQKVRRGSARLVCGEASAYQVLARFELTLRRAARGIRAVL